MLRVGTSNWTLSVQPWARSAYLPVPTQSMGTREKGNSEHRNEGKKLAGFDDQRIHSCALVDTRRKRWCPAQQGDEFTLALGSGFAE